MSEPALSVRDLNVVFDVPDAPAVHAVADVSFDVERGETLGLVGESGSGKSVTSLAVLGLVPSPPGRVVGGSVRFEGRDLLRLPERELRAVRGGRVAMIFQDPMTSLNPLLTVGRQLTEVLEVHERASRRDARRRAVAALGEVGIPAPEARLAQYPHELSGGMRQRVMIAMALLGKPAVLLADEPTTALDVTIQAQILELLARLQHEHGTAVVLITHDLGVVATVADRVCVMYAGRIVEAAATRALFRRALHPYTFGLLTSVPTLHGDPERPLTTIPGQPPDLAALPPGCAYAPRCPIVQPHCRAERPRLVPVAVPRAGDEPSRLSACFEAVTLASEPEITR